MGIRQQTFLKSNLDEMDITFTMITLLHYYPFSLFLPLYSFCNDPELVDTERAFVYVHYDAISCPVMLH